MGAARSDEDERGHVHDPGHPSAAPVPDAEQAPAASDHPPVTAWGRSWWWIAAFAVLACAGVQLAVAWSARTPSFPFDEVSTFQMSRMLAGDVTPAVRGAGYFPGWAFLLAPIWWFTDDPLTFYRVGAVLGVLVSLLTIVPLALLGRRWGLRPAQAVAGAAIVMTMPVRSVQADYLLSERLLVLCAALAALAAYRLAERPTWRRAPELGLWLSLGLFTHARFLPVLAAAAVWLLLLAVRHVRVALLALVVLAAGGAAAQWGGTWLNERLLGRPFSQDDAFSQVLAQLTPGLLARTVLGQSWYQLVASAGLVVVGLVVLAVLVGRELRRWTIGGATFVAGTCAAATLSSMLRWADVGWLYDNPWRRLDVWIYGRYADALLVLVTMLGVSVVLRVAARRVLLTALVASGALAAVVVLWLAPRAPTWGFVTPAHIPGVLPFWPLLPDRPWPSGERVASTLTGENRFWLVASLVVLAVVVALVPARRAPRSVAVGLLALAVVGSLVADVRSDRFQDVERPDPTAIAQVQRLVQEAPGARVVFDGGCSRGGSLTATAQNYLGFRLLPLDLEVEDLATRRPAATDVVASCADWERAGPLGARRLTGADVWGSAFWVLPGPVQDRAESLGLLEPRGSA